MYEELTPERAIEILNHESVMDYLLQDISDDLRKARRMSIEALEEIERRNKGCSFCIGHGTRKDGIVLAKVYYCPMCGRDLKIGREYE